MFEEIKHNEGQDKRKILQEGSKKDNFNQRKRDKEAMNHILVHFNKLYKKL